MKNKILIIFGAISSVVIVAVILKSQDPKTLLFAYHDGGTNGFTIDLRDNGEYVVENSSWLTSEVVRGRYSIADSIVTLDRKNIEGVILTSTLKICDCPYNKISNIKPPITSCLIQVDEKGKNVDTHFGFVIKVDNRR